MTYSQLPGLETARPPRRVRRSLDVTLSARRQAGTLSDLDAALVGLARTLADQIDDEVGDPRCKRYTVGALAGRLFPILVELRATGGEASDHVDDEFDSIVGALRDTA